jgi:hypothetical protein
VRLWSVLLTSHVSLRGVRVPADLLLPPLAQRLFSHLEIFAANFESYSPKEVRLSACQSCGRLVAAAMPSLLLCCLLKSSHPLCLCVQVEVSVSSQASGDQFGRRKRLHLARSNSWVTLLSRGQLRQLGLSRATPVVRIRVAVLANHSGGVNSKVCALRVFRLPAGLGESPFASASGDALAGRISAMPPLSLSFCAVGACLHAVTLRTLCAAADADALAAKLRTSSGAPTQPQQQHHGQRVTTRVVDALVRELETQVRFQPTTALHGASGGGARSTDASRIMSPVAVAGGDAAGGGAAAPTPGADGVDGDANAPLIDVRNAPLWILRVLHDAAAASPGVQSALCQPGIVERIITAVYSLEETRVGAWFQCIIALSALLRVVLPLCDPSQRLTLAVCTQRSPLKLTLPLIDALCAMIGVGCNVVSAVVSQQMLDPGADIEDAVRQRFAVTTSDSESKSEHFPERECKDGEGASDTPAAAVVSTLMPSFRTSVAVCRRVAPQHTHRFAHGFIELLSSLANASSAWKHGVRTWLQRQLAQLTACHTHVPLAASSAVALYAAWVTLKVLGDRHDAGYITGVARWRSPVHGDRECAVIVVASEPCDGPPAVSTTAADGVAEGGAAQPAQAAAGGHTPVAATAAPATGTAGSGDAAALVSRESGRGEDIAQVIVLGAVSAIRDAMATRPRPSVADAGGDADGDGGGASAAATGAAASRDSSAQWVQAVRSLCSDMCVTEVPASQLRPMYSLRNTDQSAPSPPPSYVRLRDFAPLLVECLRDGRTNVSLSGNMEIVPANAAGGAHLAQALEFVAGIAWEEVRLSAVRLLVDTVQHDSSAVVGTLSTHGVSTKDDTTAAEALPWLLELQHLPHLVTEISSFAVSQPGAHVLQILQRFGDTQSVNHSSSTGVDGSATQPAETAVDGGVNVTQMVSPRRAVQPDGGGGDAVNASMSRAAAPAGSAAASGGGGAAVVGGDIMDDPDMQSIIGMTSRSLDVVALERHTSELFAAAMARDLTDPMSTAASVDDTAPVTASVAVTFVTSDTANIVVEQSKARSQNKGGAVVDAGVVVGTSSGVAASLGVGGSGAGGNGTTGGAFNGRVLLGAKDVDAHNRQGRDSAYSVRSSSSAGVRCVRGRLIALVSDQDFVLDAANHALPSDAGVLDLAGGVVMVEMPFPGILDDGGGASDAASGGDYAWMRVAGGTPVTSDTPVVTETGTWSNDDGRTPMSTWGDPVVRVPLAAVLCLLARDVRLCVRVHRCRCL